MRTVLCYGDSNTRGFYPETGEEFVPDVRWPRVPGEGFRGVEEALSARTTVRDDPIEGAHKYGRTYLRACTGSHEPVDLVALVLGPNELEQRFAASASDIAQEAAVLAEILR